jgi:DNA-binding NarL/FixJ family response regulator
MKKDNGKIRIMLSETQYLVKQGLLNLIRENEDFEPAGTVHNLSELSMLPHYRGFDVLIVDKNFGDYFTPENLEKTADIFGKCKVLVISDSDKETIYRIHKLNITGFITIESEKQEIMDAIRKTADGIKFFSPKIVEALIAMTYGEGGRPGVGGRPSPQEVKDHFGNLSEREKEILKLVVKGKTAQEMADELFLSIHTIYTHRKNILKKLSCKNATELLNYAMSKGFMETR